MVAPLKHYRVVTTAEAKEDLRELRHYIAERFSREAANRYLSELQVFAAELAHAPVRGRSLEHTRPGMRVIGFKHRVAVVFAVFPEERIVEIQGFDYGGRQQSQIDRQL